MKAEKPDYSKRVMTACRRVWMSVALFGASLNMLMLSVPLYMMRLYGHVPTTGNVDILLGVTVMVAVALLVLSLLDALRGRIMARDGAWLDREPGGPILWPVRSTVHCGSAAACLAGSARSD